MCRKVTTIPTLAMSSNFLLPNLSMKKRSDTNVAVGFVMEKDPESSSTVIVPSKLISLNIYGA
jgi:hypothetical protein